MKKSKTILASLRRPVRSLIRKPGQSQVLVKVLSSLAPSLIKHPDVVRKIEQYIFQRPARNGESTEPKEIHIGLKEEVKRLAGFDTDQTAGIFWTTIEGMRLTALEEGLEAQGELDSFMEQEKESFKARLYGAGQGTKSQDQQRVQDRTKSAFKRWKSGC
ncbi:MAG: hypothetical protein HRU41_41930 [Saprospiraceae bacterium]|nr:hypothetical protein [Saprospiraceae bacterium]